MGVEGSRWQSVKPSRLTLSRHGQPLPVQVFTRWIIEFEPKTATFALARDRIDVV